MPSIIEPYADGRSEERRLHRRYPVAVRLKFHVLHGMQITETGSGQTLNISSGGILFESWSAPPPGLAIDLSILWPSSLHSRGIWLRAAGHTVRTQDHYSAVWILSHDFRL